MYIDKVLIQIAVNSLNNLYTYNLIFKNLLASTAFYKSVIVDLK